MSVVAAPGRVTNEGSIKCAQRTYILTRENEKHIFKNEGGMMGEWNGGEEIKGGRKKGGGGEFEERGREEL